MIGSHSLKVMCCITWGGRCSKLNKKKSKWNKKKIKMKQKKIPLQRTHTKFWRINSDIMKKQNKQKLTAPINLLVSRKIRSSDHWGLSDPICKATRLCSLVINMRNVLVDNNDDLILNLNHNVCKVASPGCSFTRASPALKQWRFGVRILIRVFVIII